MNFFDEKTIDLEDELERANQALSYALIAQEKDVRVSVSDAQQAVDEAEYNLSRHLLNDPQDDWDNGRFV